MLITCLLKIVAFRADHQVKCKCWWLLHTQNCVKLHHTQIHHGGNGMKCDFPTREVEISTSFFTVYLICKPKVRYHRGSLWRFTDSYRVDFTETVLFKSSGIICLPPPSSMLPDGQKILQWVLFNTKSVYIQR